MALLTYDWRPQSTEFITGMLESAARLNAQREQQASNMAMQLLESQQRQAASAKRMEFEKEQAERLAAQFQQKFAFETGKEHADSARSDRTAAESRRRYDASNAPFEYTPLADLPAASSGPGTGPLIDTGQLGDPGADPFQAATPALETLGPPLPEGHPAAPAMAAQLTGDLPPVSDNALVPSGLPAQMPRAQQQAAAAAALTGAAPAAAPAAPSPQMKQIRDIAGALSEMRIPKHDAARVLASSIASIVRPPRSAASGPVVRNVAGDLVQQQEDGTWAKVYEGDERTANVTVKGTYQGSDGKIYSQMNNGKWDVEPPGGVTLSRIGAPKANGVKGTYQGSDGKLYTQFANGEWDTEPPEGVKISRIGAPEKDATTEQKEKAFLGEVTQWQKEAEDAEKALGKLKPARWPWSKDGKYYRDNAGETEEIDKTTFENLHAREQEKADAIAAKKKELEDFRGRAQTAKQKLDELRGSPGPAVAPVPAVAPGAPATAPAAAPAGPKPLPPEMAAQAKAAIPKKGREAVLARLKSLGYDTAGL